MPALDRCHEQVVRALEKGGWEIRYSPYVLPVSTRHRLYIDIYAQRVQDGAQQQIIIVETKCFAEYKAELHELYTAIGQYIIYRSMLSRAGIPGALFLAIPTHAHAGVFQQIAIPIIEQYQIKLMVIDVEREEIEQWLT